MGAYSSVIKSKLSISFEHLVICDELLQNKSPVKELKTDEEYLGYDAIARVGHGGNYICDKHLGSYERRVAGTCLILILMKHGRARLN